MVAKNKLASIRRLVSVPVIKKVDIEQLKEGFKSNAAKEKEVIAKKEASEVVSTEALVVGASIEKKDALKKTTKEGQPVATKAAPNKEGKEGK